MSEIEEAPKIESPKKTHNRWFEKSLAKLQLVAGGVAGTSAVLNFVNEIKTIQTIEAISSVAKELGATVSPESLQPLLVKADLHHMAGILGLVAAGCFFTTGGISYLEARLRKK